MCWFFLLLLDSMPVFFSSFLCITYVLPMIIFHECERVSSLPFVAVVASLLEVCAFILTMVLIFLNAVRVDQEIDFVYV